MIRRMIKRTAILIVLLLCLVWVGFDEATSISAASSLNAPVCCLDCNNVTEVCAEDCNDDQKCIEDCLNLEEVCLNNCSSNTLICTHFPGSGGNLPAQSCRAHYECDINETCNKTYPHTYYDAIAQRDYWCARDQTDPINVSKCIYYSSLVHYLEVTTTGTCQ